MQNKNSIKKFFKLTPAKTIILGFLSIILIGAFLLCLPFSNVNHTWHNFVDALFTSTSAVCVTGLMVFDVAMELSLFGQIVVLFLIQIGGLGFVTLTCLLIMLLGKKISYSTRITLQESLNKETTAGVVRMVRKIVIVMFSIEFVGFLCLAPSFVKFTGSFWSGCFKALFLSVSAFCNAGFDPLGNLTPEFSSLAYFINNPLFLTIVMLLVITGGIGFVVLFDIFNLKKENKKLSLHTKIVLYVTGILIFGGATLFAIFEWNNPNTIGNLSTFNKLVNCLFQSITPRTAGFATLNQAGLTSGSVYITKFLMVVGGSSMSVAGGIKTTTLFVLFITLIKRTNENGSINFAKRNISTKVIVKSVKLLLAYTMLIALSSLNIYIIEMANGITYSQIVFECISALSTVGLTLGITPALTVGSKLLLTLLMFIGRVGMLTLPLAFKPKNKIIENEIEFADSKIIVG